MIEFQSVDLWSAYYNERTFVTWPSELLVRALSGNYIGRLNKSFADLKAIDVGFGDGGNLVFLASLGFDVHGVELSGKILELTNKRLIEAGIEADLRAGSNLKIPFNDGQFDFLLSWNVVHYGPDRTTIEKHIAEYARVLKPGARALVASVGPEDELAITAELVGDGQHRIRLEGDHRVGEQYYYFSSERAMSYCFSKHFHEITTGRETIKLFDRSIDTLLITCLKK